MGGAVTQPGTSVQPFTVSQGLPQNSVVAADDEFQQKVGYATFGAGWLCCFLGCCCDVPVCCIPCALWLVIPCMHFCKTRELQGMYRKERCMALANAGSCVCTWASICCCISSL